MGEPESRDLPIGDDDQTDLPVFRSWTSVYTLVISAFVLWVVLLTFLSRVFS
jgi:hypothetical protein